MLLLGRQESNHKESTTKQEQILMKQEKQHQDVMTQLKRIGENGDPAKMKRISERLNREAARAIKAETENRTLREEMARMEKDNARRTIKPRDINAEVSASGAPAGRREQAAEAGHRIRFTEEAKEKARKTATKKRSTLMLK